MAFTEPVGQSTALSRRGNLETCREIFPSAALKIALLALAILCIGIGIYSAASQPKVWEGYALLTLGTVFTATFICLILPNKVLQGMKCSFSESQPFSHESEENSPLSTTERAEQTQPPAQARASSSAALFQFREMIRERTRSYFSQPGSPPSQNKTERKNSTPAVRLSKEEKEGTARIDSLFGSKNYPIIPFADLAVSTERRYLDSDNLFFYNSIGFAFQPYMMNPVVQGRWNHGEPYYLVHMRCRFELPRQTCDDIGYLFFWQDTKNSQKWKIHMDLHGLKKYPNLRPTLVSGK